MAAPGKKIACVVGATGNQGGSVARRFLEAGFHVKALTRNTTSAAATKLAEQGAELVSVDLGDVETLKPAFAGANVIFSVTNYWEPFFRPDCRAAAEQQGVSCREYAGEVERLQGRNISDAAASTVASLDSNGFLASTLSHAERCSGGKFKDLYHFDAKADIFPTYVQEKYPELAAKMSCIQTGFFYTSFNILPNSYFGKQADGSVEMAFPTSPSKAVPHFDPVGDMGNFAYAVYQMPAGKAYMAAGTISTWPEFLAAWSKVSGYPVKYREITTDEMVTATPDRECGIEVAAMFAYSSDPGYDGAMDLLTAQDIRKAGLECPMTTWPEWAARQDWKAIMERLG